MPKKRQVFRFLAVLSAVLLALPVACTARPPTSLPQAPATASTNTDHTNMTAPEASAAAPTPVSGCEIQDYTLDSAGAGAPFAEPPEGPPVQNGTLTTTLTVQYGRNKIGQCAVDLRSYNGKLVGPTLRARPGDTLRITLDNQLPAEDAAMHHVMNTIGDLNHTNLHTHGLHVSPKGNSDNVLLDIAPGQKFGYEINIPPNQPPGTYWYHAHLHGSTATQVSSGMEGALIVMGDQLTDPRYSPNIDQIPAVKEAAEKIFVFQQIVYDEAGQIEPTAEGGGNFNAYNSKHEDSKITYFGPCNWEPMQRAHTINGLLFPKLTMVTGEVQRWRFIDAGIRETIGVQLIGPYDSPDEINLNAIDPEKVVPLNEIAVDGIALKSVDSWSQVELEPGYRSDVMVKLNKPGTYYLVDTNVPQVTVTRDPLTGKYSTSLAGASFSLTCGATPEKPSFLATVLASDPVTKAEKELSTILPTTEDMKSLKVPDNLADIVEINKELLDPNNLQPIQPNDEAFLAPVPSQIINSFQKVDFTVAVHNISPSTLYPGRVEFMAADHPFDPLNPRRLLLGNTDEWVLNTQEDSLYYAHPFHIHVNPFQTWRPGPDGTPEIVWKDTILVRQGVTTYIFTRYEDFDGKFVYHCHILDHEDQGMMELIEIIDPASPTATPSP